jgi:phosphoenolpyruvate-protein kinase (PTS system EI component)
MDSVPVESMRDAESRLHQSIKDLPEELRNSLEAADELNNKDQEAIIAIARKTLADFHLKEE